MRFKTKDLLVTVLPKAETVAEDARLCLMFSGICVRPSACPDPTLCVRTNCGVSRCAPCTWQGTCFCSVGTVGCQVFASCGGPGGSACDPTYWCLGGSREPWQGAAGMSHGTPCCPGLCMAGSHEQLVIQDREDLVALRAELQDTLKKLDELEESGLASGLRSKAEAEQVERSLGEALTQVQALKKKLK